MEVWLAACCYLVVLVSGTIGTDPAIPNQINGTIPFSSPQFGNTSTFLNGTVSYVFHMAEDQYVPGNIIFSDGSALKTTDGQTITLIAGATGTSYREGIGSVARFGSINSFFQLSMDEVLVADQEHCLRHVDRVTQQTSTYAGQCFNGGWVDGFGKFARFHSPTSIVQDKRNPNNLFIADMSNDAIRQLNLVDKGVRTIMKRNVIQRPNGMVQDYFDHSILYINTRTSQIFRFNLDTGDIARIAGSSVGFNDGPFDKVQFNVLKEILQISATQLLAVDVSNNKLRVLDLSTNVTSSICSGIMGSQNGDLSGCALHSPQSLLMLNDSLYIGERYGIRKIEVAMPEMSTAAPLTSTANNPPSCVSRNITINLSPGQESVEVEVFPGLITWVKAGIQSFEFTTDDNRKCFSIVTVNTGGTNVTTPNSCPRNITAVTSPLTNTTSVIIPLGEVSHEVELPAGSYQSTIYRATTNCSLLVQVFDYRVHRRLEFLASYNIPCSAVNNAETTSLIEETSNHNYFQILEICGAECRRPTPSTKPKLSCQDDLLTIRWPTDITYSADVSDVPGVIKNTLTSRLVAKGSMLQLVIISRVPPVIYPARNANGAFARVDLSPYCTNGLTYNPLKLTCE